jgi:transcriptional regulator with XRE-family HTH domain
MTLGKRLAYLREKHGWSIAEAARQLDTIYTTYNGYEKDEREPAHSFLIKASALYKVSVDFLLGISDEQPPNNFTLLPNSVCTKLYKICTQLSEEEQNRILGYAQAVLDSVEKNESELKKMA